MEENQIRIGNAFCQKGSNFVEYVTFETFELLSRKVIIIDPIPLTKVWLFEKFNFSWSNKFNCYMKDTPDDTPFFLDKNFVVLDIDLTIEIKYVHQLQNLYFAITGEELKLNEK
jgi:hypothetical protein